MFIIAPVQAIYFSIYIYLLYISLEAYWVAERIAETYIG